LLQLNFRLILFPGNRILGEIDPYDHYANYYEKQNCNYFLVLHTLLHPQEQPQLSAESSLSFPLSAGGIQPVSSPT
jgi:hypothetical protein